MHPAVARDMAPRLLPGVRVGLAHEEGREAEMPKATMKVRAAVTPLRPKTWGGEQGQHGALLADHPAHERVDRDEQSELTQVLAQSKSDRGRLCRGAHVSAARCRPVMNFQPSRRPTNTGPTGQRAKSEEAAQRSCRARPRGDGQAGESPLREAIFEPTGSSSGTSEQRHALRGEGAVGTPAVRHDLRPGRQVSEVRLKLGEWNRDRAGDVPGLVLLVRPEVDDDRVAGADPFEQLGPAHRLHRFAHVGASRPLGVGDPFRRNGPDRRQQLVDVVSGEAVDDPRPVAPRDDQARTPERLEVRRREADRDGRPSGENLDTALALGEQVEQLDAVRVSERAADLGELLV